MNLFQFEFSEFTILLNAVVRIVTAFVFLIFILPLLFKESRVKNGLRVLRVEMLMSGSIIFFINTIGLIVIVFRIGNIPTQAITNFVTYFNTFGFLLYAILQLRIYTQKYTPDQKKLHEKFYKMEVIHAQKVKKEEENRIAQEKETST